MLSQGHLSPRDAIYSWLEQTYDAEYRDRSHDEPINSKQRREHKGPQSYLDDVLGVCPTNETYIPKNLRTEISPKGDVTSNYKLPGLAKRLGLHEPFQAMERRVVNEELDQCAGKRSRKQKRKRTSSATSYLEPAVFEEAVNNGNARYLEDEAISPKKLAITSNSEMLEIPAKLDHPIKTLMTYEKKPRHKTREDRYELKCGRMRKPSTKPAETNARKKNRRKERSGAALSHNFTAKNVEPDRLTLRPTASLGLFTKGRASFPVRRRGLPDLSFSEMSFLNSRRELLDRGAGGLNAKESSEKKKKKQQLAVGHDNEISKFFISNTEPLTGRCVDSGGSSPRRTQATINQHSRQSSTVTPYLPPVDLAERPFLGFGKPVPGSQSPSQSRKSSNVISRHVDRQTRPDTVVDTTSYYTWSQSPTRTNISINRAAEDSAYAKSTRKLSKEGPAKIRLDRVQALPSAKLQLEDTLSINASMDTIQPRKIQTAGISLGKACGEDSTGQPMCADNRTHDERNTDDNGQICNTVPCHPKNTLNSAGIAPNVDAAINKSKIPDSAALMESVEESLHRSMTSELVPEEISARGQISITDPQKIDTIINGASIVLPPKLTNLQGESGEPPKQTSISARSPRNDSREEDPPMTVHQYPSPKLRASDSVETSFAAMNRHSQRPSSRLWDMPDLLYQQQIPTPHIQQDYPSVEDKHQLHRFQSEIPCPSIRLYGTPISLETRTPEIYSRNRRSSLQIDTDTPHRYEGDDMDRQDAHIGTEISTDEVLEKNSTGWANIETQRELDNNTLDVRDSSQCHRTWDGFRPMESRGAVFAYTQYPIHERNFQDYPIHSSDRNFVPQTRSEEHRSIGVPEEETFYERFAPTHLSVSSNTTCGLLRKSLKLGYRPLTSGYIPERQPDIPGQLDEGILTGFWRPNKLY